MPLKTVVTKLLAIRHPILLAPMAGVSGGALAAAVSRAGGLGLIGGGYGDRSWLEREFNAAGNARIGVGFIAWALERQPGLLDLALDGHVPVVAAGGIADGRGMAAALMLGAAGVLCGTAFCTSHEALAHPSAKLTAVSASGDLTVRSSAFDIARGLDWPPTWKLRTLRNRFTDAWEGSLDELKECVAIERTKYAAAVASADFDTAAVIVGEAVDLVVRMEPAGEILRRMAADAERLLTAAPKLLAG